MTDIIELAKQADLLYEYGGYIGSKHIEVQAEEYIAKLTKFAQLLQQGEATISKTEKVEAVAVTPDFFQLDNGSDYWYECPDDEAIISELDDVTVGTEYTVFASHTYRQTYRVTKIPDETDDDTLVELVRSQRKYFTTPPDTQQKLDKAREALQIIVETINNLKRYDFENDGYEESGFCVEIENKYGEYVKHSDIKQAIKQPLKDIE